MSARSPLPTEALEEAVSAAVAEHAGRPGPLLPILHAIQERLGHVPAEVVPSVALALNLTRAEVHGVISFYHDFRDHPPGRHLLKICRAESCQALGADALVAHAKKKLGVGFHETTADGAITLEPVYCLGNCALSPALLVGEDIRGRVTAETFDALVDELRGAR